MNMVWNDLHEELGLLFQRVMLDKPINVGAPGRLRVIWGLISSDRQKRLLLEGVSEWLGQQRHLKFPTLADDLKFLVRKGHTLEDRRNDVIHAPLDEHRNALSLGTMGEVYANNLNTRGRKLTGATRKSNQQLLSVIRLYRDYAIVLARYAEAIRLAWIAGESGRRRAWPKRPLLPPLKD